MTRLFLWLAFAFPLFAQSVEPTVSMVPVVTFQSVTGKSYQISSSSTMEDFIPVEIIEGNGELIQWTDFRQLPTKQFYQVKEALAQPDSTSVFIFTVSNATSPSWDADDPKTLDVRVGNRLEVTFSPDSVTIGDKTFSAELFERVGTRAEASWSESYFLRGAPLLDGTAATLVLRGSENGPSWQFRYENFAELYYGPAVSR